MENVGEVGKSLHKSLSASRLCVSPHFSQWGEVGGCGGGVGAIGSVCGGGEVGRVGVGQCGGLPVAARGLRVWPSLAIAPLWPESPAPVGGIASGQRWPVRGVSPFWPCDGQRSRSLPLLAIAWPKPPHAYGKRSFGHRGIGEPVHRSREPLPVGYRMAKSTPLRP